MSAGRVAGGDEDDRHAVPALGEAAGELESVDVREHDVEQDQGRIPRHRGGEGVVSGAGRRHVESFVPERRGEQVGDGGFVVDHEDPCRCRGRPHRCASCHEFV